MQGAAHINSLIIIVNREFLQPSSVRIVIVFNEFLISHIYISD